MQKKKWLMAAPVLSAFLLTAALLALAVFNSNRIQKRGVNEFELGTSDYVWAVEQVDAGSFFGSVQGYCYPSQTLHDYYNFGINARGKAVYFNAHLALVSGESVFVLPTTAVQRSELLAQPQAAEISQTVAYNFYAGVHARFVQRMIPAGNYRIGIVTSDMEGREYLLLTDREWVS